MKRTRYAMTVTKARIETNTTLADMARFMGKGAAYVSGLEHQRHRITEEDSKKIVEFFNKHNYKANIDWLELISEANSQPLKDLNIDLESSFTCQSSFGMTEQCLDQRYMSFAENYAIKSAEYLKSGAYIRLADGGWSTAKNVGYKHACIVLLDCLGVEAKRATLYVTHEVDRQNAMRIVEAGVMRVVYKHEHDNGMGTSILRAMGVKVDQI